MLLSLCALVPVFGKAVLCLTAQAYNPQLFTANIYIGPFRNNLLTHMNNLRDEENMISVELLCVNACCDEHDAGVLVSNKQSFQYAVL